MAQVLIMNPHFEKFYVAFTDLQNTNLKPYNTNIFN